MAFSLVGTTIQVDLTLELLEDLLGVIQVCLTICVHFVISNFMCDPFSNNFRNLDELVVNNFTCATVLAENKSSILISLPI